MKRQRKVTSIILVTDAYICQMFLLDTVYVVFATFFLLVTRSTDTCSIWFPFVLVCLLYVLYNYIAPVNFSVRRVFYTTERIIGPFSILNDLDKAFVGKARFY